MGAMMRQVRCRVLPPGCFMLDKKFTAETLSAQKKIG